MKNTGLEGRENLSQIVAFLAKASIRHRLCQFAEANWQWQRLAFATGFADFNAEANGKHIRICRWQSRQMQRLGGF
jgi:hypothetical protein